MPENHKFEDGAHGGPESCESVILVNPSKRLSLLRESEWASGQRAYGFGREMRLRDLWEILVRRKTVLFATLLPCLLAGALICAFATRRYMATAELQVGRETEKSLGLQPDSSQEPPSDALSDDVILQTQARILQSDTLALKVIDDLSLESTQDFRPKFSAIGYAMGIFAPAGPLDPSHATLENSPQRRAHVLQVFRSNLDVKAIPGTRLVEISYLNPDPELAAQIVNHLASGLVDYNFEIRHEATARTAEWLAGQMSDLRQQSEDLQAKVAQLQRESGVFSLGETDASGREQVYSSVLDKLQQSTTALSQAQANRIGRAAIYQMVKTGDPEAISQLSGSSIFASSSGLDTSLSLIQNMRMEEANLRGQVGEMSAKFGSAYPKLSEMQSHLDALSDSIHEAVNRVAERAKNDYEVAQQVEDNAHKIYTEQKREADLVNDKTIEYMIARQEADESRNLYESLFKQLKQAGVLAGFRADNITLVDPGRVPARPAKPRTLLYMAAALAGGLFLGAGAALVMDGVDPQIHDLAALESELGQGLLSVLPYHKTAPSRFALTGRPRTLGARAQGSCINETVLHGSPAEQKDQNNSRNHSRSSDWKLRMPSLNEPHSVFVESLRALRTSLLHSKSRTPPKVILVTSSVPGEGKSMLSANFAAILADQHKRVLLVDADLRHPNLHHTLNISSETGLSWLLGFAAAEDSASSPGGRWPASGGVEQVGQTFEAAARSVVVPVPDVPQLYFVPSGSIVDHPAELLSSGLMSQAIRFWRSDFDYIVIDGSPILPVTDAVILSGMVDFTLLTARFQVVEQQALLRAHGILQSQVGNNNIGIVLNAVRKTAGAYYPSYGYASSRVNTNIRGVGREHS